MSTSPLAYALLMALTSAAPDATADAVSVAQVEIRRTIVVRVPVMQSAPVPMPIRRWTELSGPKCVAMNNLAAASVTRADAIDLVLRSGSRLRARLADRCDAGLLFADGFYISPTPDGRLCADRDAVRSRMGGVCTIDRFKALVAER